MPSSPKLSQTSLIDLITKILDANTNNEPGIFSRYDHLWSTIDPSLGDRYLVPNGDLDALSCALNSIFEEHGLLIPSIECRDAGGCVWIGFRGDADPKSRRYATIWTSVYKGRYISAGWKECLEKMKREMAAATKKDSPSINVASRGLRAPDGKISGIRLARATTLSSKQTMGTHETTAPTTIAERMRRMRTHDMIGPSRTRPQETKEAISAIDGGAQQRIIAAAGPCRNRKQRISEPLVEGEWIVVDVNLHEEDEWTKI